MFYKKCRNQLEENSDVSKKIPKSQKSSDTDSIFMRIVSVLVVIIAIHKNKTAVDRSGII